MARKIVIVSGKGGVGKTTVVAQISAYLAKKGQRVALFDGDFGLNDVDLRLGVENLVTYDIVDVIEGRCRAKQALVRHNRYPNLFILTSGRASPERYISPQAVKVALDSLSPSFDFIFIDAPAGIEEGFHRAVGAADEAMVITTPHISSLRDADKVITLLKSYRLNGLSVVVNRIRGDLLLSGDCLSPKEIEELLKTPVVGVVPEENDLSECTLSETHASFKSLGNYLLTGRKKLYDVTKKYGGFFGNIRRALKRRL